MVGFVRWRSENDRNELWVPANSDLYKINKWMEEKFPSTTRFQQYMLVTENGDNILTKANFQLLLAISKNISTLR